MLKIQTQVLKTSNGKTVLSKCAICGGKKSRFIKKQEANGLLGSLIVVKVIVVKVVKEIKVIK